MREAGSSLDAPLKYFREFRSDGRISGGVDEVIGECSEFPERGWKLFSPFGFRIFSPGSCRSDLDAGYRRWRGGDFCIQFRIIPPFLAIGDGIETSCSHDCDENDENDFDARLYFFAIYGALRPKSSLERQLPAWYVWMTSSKRLWDHL